MKGNKKKILLVPEITEPGGAMTYAGELIKFYSESGYTVALCIPSEYLFPALSEITEKYGTKICLIPGRREGRRNIWRIPPFSMLQDLFLIIGPYMKTKPDLIVVSSVHPEAFLGLVFLPRPFLGIIHTYHLFYLPWQGKKEYANRFINFIYRILMKGLFQRPDKKLIAVSAFSKRKIHVSFSIPEKSVLVIHNFSHSISAEKQLNRKGMEKRILTLGHVRDYKNPFVWIKVAEKVLSQSKDANLYFIWGGTGELLDECRIAASQTAFSDRIVFAGYMEDTKACYRESYVYFQPSRVENHSIAVVEALAHALPCVVSDIGGQTESVTDEWNGFTAHPEDTERMAAAILKLLTDAALYQEMSKRSLALFEQKFTHQAWKEKMNQLTNQILS
jgi:glycosyltransferase involved in cell wall biosynthesis